MTDIPEVTEVEYRARNPRHPVSAVFVRPSPEHWRMRIFNRGALAGVLMVRTQDGPYVLESLLPLPDRYIVNPNDLLTVNPRTLIPSE